MNRRGVTGLGAIAACLYLCAPRAATAADIGDFALGANTEHEACRAVTRFDGPRGGDASDIYCGAWERPSGRVTLYPSQAAAQAAVAAVCQGEATPLQSADFSPMRQIACARTDQNGPRRYVLLAQRGQATVVGEVYPSDWGPLINAARVLSGAEKPTAVAAGDAGGQTPGLREIEAVFPSGPPGQAATSNYELLLRRAYEYNAIWSFDTAERDFEELLRMHSQVAPDDVDGEAEILAEIGLNMSNARRFDEASDVFGEAEARARDANDALLATKILNYRAVNELNQHHYTTALRTALQANQARAQLVQGSQNQAGTRISANDVGRVEATNISAGQRSLLVSLSDAPSADRAAFLTAQAYYIAAAAARGLGHADGVAYLQSASEVLQHTANPPGWLVADITNELADSRLAAGDFAGAEAAAQAGLVIMAAAAPGARAEAHLWLTMEGAEAAQGRTADALASGRQALAIYARQMESPGLPPDIAAAHLALLEKEWRRTGDAGLAAEYFQTLSLVWDSAAARTTAQLAARLVLKQAGSQARTYQDAERAYRAALARQQQLAADADTPGDQKAVADAAVHDTANRFALAEAALRDRAPAYLELLNPQASAADLQSTLGDHEAYLRIVVGAESGYAVLVDKTAVHPFVVALSADQVDALADRFQRSTHIRGRRLPDFDMDASEKLYAALIAPVQDRLANVDTLDVDVSGSLASIPFAALVASVPDKAHLDKIRDDQDYTGVDWLARHVSVANTLGPASFIRLRKAISAPPAQLQATVYGDYVPNPAEVAARIAKERNLSDSCKSLVQHDLQLLGPLPETADEARGIAAKFPGARLVMGPAFTDTDFLHSPDTANADIIMLATHGVLGLSSCFGEPALLTSVGGTGDGLIEASQLFDTDLKARVVVLSACDTAGGGKLDEARTGLADGGDALSGLARGFIYAGARNVLATEWKVDAATSSAEINGFFQGAGQPNTGLGKALAAAQKQIYDQAETAHPFYWAAFVLVGDGAGLSKGLRLVYAGTSRSSPMFGPRTLARMAMVAAAAAAWAGGAQACPGVGVITRIEGRAQDLVIVRTEDGARTVVTRPRVLEVVCYGDVITAVGATYAMLSIEGANPIRVDRNGAYHVPLPQGARSVFSNGYNALNEQLMPDMKRLPWTVRLKGAGDDFGFAVPDLTVGGQRVRVGDRALLVRLVGGAAPYKVEIRDARNAVVASQISIGHDVILPHVTLEAGAYRLSASDATPRLLDAVIVAVNEVPPSDTSFDSFADPEVRAAAMAANLARNSPALWSFEAEQELQSAPENGLDRDKVYELIESYGTD